jgi:retron-type reverse transcriptase
VRWAVDEGVPQRGPLSPLLSNLVLDELDQELQRRGRLFVRYADDSNVYVRTERAGVAAPPMPISWARRSGVGIRQIR